MNFKRFRLFAVIFLMISVLILTSCGEIAPEAEDYEVRVILRDCEGITISGDNIIDTRSGRTVTFRVSVDEGYVYIGNTAGAEFSAERGTLRISSVFAPTTIDMIVAPEDEVITLRVAKNNPSVSVSIAETLLGAPGEITISADGPDYLMFAGWSEDGYLDDGGALISTEKTHTFYVDASKTLYANFSGFSEYKIIYNLNGGTTVDGDEKYTAYGSYSGIYSMQQTLESNGTFVRDGYVAVGYSLEPADYADYASVNDIPGFSNMGGVCSVPGESLDLYVVWAKENPASDFDYEKKTIQRITDVFPGSLAQSKENVDGVEITGYKGSGELVVIPEKIDGLPVMSIAADAFSGDFERVVIPRTMQNIAKGAFESCKNLREVVFFDSVATVYNESFHKNVQTVVLNSQRLPVYSGAVEGSFAVKYERMRTSAGKKIIVVSGSSSLNGLNSELFEELMPGYTVVNYGTNAANPSLFFLDVISKYVTEGDIVIHAPEYSSRASMGSNAFHAKVFRGNEQCYDIFRDVDISDYEDFWESFREFQIGDPGDGSLVPALHQQGKPYQLDADINKYGDIAVSRPSVRGSFGGSTEGFKYDVLNYENLNRINEKYIAAGAELLMSFGTFDKSRLMSSAAVQSEFDKFTNYCADNLDYPVISNIGTYIMEHSSFYDSEWHPNEEGARERTRNLVTDIKAYLADPSKY